MQSHYDLQYYQFTTFAMSLNELESELEEIVCPTDSRLRPDIRKLETGDQDGAASEKARLEEKQRNSRKARKQKKGNEYIPRYNYAIYFETSYLIFKKLKARFKELKFQGVLRFK